MSSKLGLRIKRTGDLLKNSATDQIIDYNKKFDSVKGFYDGLLKDLIVQKFDIGLARDTTVRFFGSDRVRFVAIDGTEYPKAMYDFVVFFGGAYACEGEISFQKDGSPLVHYDSDFLNQGFGLSSCVPVYVNKIPEIDQVFMDLSEPGQVNLRRPLTDEVIINNASIASWIMTFSEFYLAYRLASDSSKNYRIILMDRSLSNMHSSLIYDTSRRRLWEKNSTIYGLEVDGKPVDMNDLAYGRHHIINTELSPPPPRGDYLRYSIIYLLEEEGPLSINNINEKLGISEEGRRNRVGRYLKKSLEEGYLIESDGVYRLNPRYNDTWDRLKKLVIMIGNQLFEQQTQNPMTIKKGGQLKWLTTQDLAFLTLFCFYMLIEECWKRKNLLIGITKDTSAREFKNHVIPVCINNGIWTSKITQEDLDKVPNTDRMLLQSISLFNYQDVKVPWSLIEYDSAFMMISLR
ncbi:MAG: winged helix-turn-helix domain-containing protein [Nitrososphaerales archaeon]